MIHIVESSKSVQEIEKLFPETAAKYKFGVLGVHNLKQKMNDKGVPFDRECRIFEVCNPQQARKVLEGDMKISTALPCRVSVFEEGGKTKIATLRPSALIGMFQNDALRSVAEEVEKSLFQIMKDLA